MPWELEYDPSFPALPVPVAPSVIGPSGIDLKEHLQHGCHLIRLTPTAAEWVKAEGHFTYEGVLRVQWHDNGKVLASGDLYLHFWTEQEPVRRRQWRLENKVANPIFPRSLYRYYFRLERLAATFDSCLDLQLDLHLFRYSRQEQSWHDDGLLSAHLRRERESQLPDHQELAGVAKNPKGTSVAAISAWHVQEEFLRRAAIQVHTVAGLDHPTDPDGKPGEDWRKAYEEVGWKIDIDFHELDDDPDRQWKWSELHRKAMELRGGPGVLDERWISTLLCVGRLPRGMGRMFDYGETDYNGVTREVAALAAGWRFSDDSRWGDARGRLLRELPTVYFLSAVHEIGHTQHLYHNSADKGFMQDLWKAAGELSGRFPKGLKLAFAERDALRLAHAPDPWVRPGGMVWGSRYRSWPTPEQDFHEEPPGLSLKVSPYDRILPLGAPLRLHLRVRTEKATPVPKTLSLNTGGITARIVGAHGTRNVRTLVLDVRQDPPPILLAGGSRTGDLTLIRGDQGALMPSPGVYRVELDLVWDPTTDGRRYFSLTASTDVLVTAREDSAEAALHVLAEPALMLPLVLHTDPDGKGEAALRVAREDDTLRPHYDYIECQRRLETVGSVRDIVQALSVLDEGSVLTLSEILRLVEVLRTARAAARSRKSLRGLVRTLWRKANRLEADRHLLRRLRRVACLYGIKGEALD